MDCAELIHETDRAAVMAVLAEMVSGARMVARTTYRYHHRDGSWRVLETMWRNLLEAPAVRGMVLHSRDMSAWRQLEGALEESRSAAYELADVRQSLIDQLNELNTSKAQLSSMLVHDLKSPLTAITLNAKFAIEDAADAVAVTEYARTISRAAETVHRMVLDLLDIGRSEDGMLVANLEPFDLGGMVRTVGDRCPGLVGAKAHRIAYAIEPGLETVPGDADLLSRVLQNLLDNCCKYAPKGTELVAGARIVDDRVELSVADRGPGVPDAYKEKIFELYARIERDAKLHARTSRGVGLRFCALALQAHGGRIWVEDRDGGGSVFRMQWPR